MTTSDECYTPAEWLRHARAALAGRIDVDPCSSREAQQIVRARHYYTARTNGLTKAWPGRVWLNPPYSDPSPWVDKLIAEYEAHTTVAAVALLNARTGSEWFQRLGRVAWRCEKRKRIAFYGPGCRASSTDSQKQRSKSGFMDNVFFYLGPMPERFASAFEGVGAIVAPSVTLAVTPELENVVCIACRRPLRGLRADAVTCGPACKQRVYRQRSRT